jgi:hypothetical protein
VRKRYGQHASAELSIWTESSCSNASKGSTKRRSARGQRIRSGELHAGHLGMGDQVIGQPGTSSAAIARPGAPTKGAPVQKAWPADSGAGCGIRCPLE